MGASPENVWSPLDGGDTEVAEARRAVVFAPLLGDKHPSLSEDDNDVFHDPGSEPHHHHHHHHQPPRRPLDSFDEETTHSENQSALFYDQLQNERAAWAAERAELAAERKQLLGVIAIQQKELANVNVQGRERAIEVARSFGDAVGVFEQRLIAVEQGVMTELKLLRSRMSQGKGESERMKEIERKIEWLCVAVAPNN
jgi:hypothetical protein